MPYAYTEDQLVEQPANASGPPSPWPSPSGRGNDELFAEYSAGPNPHPRHFSHWEEGGRPAGLRVRSLVLASRLRAALERLNPALPPEAIAALISAKIPISPRGKITVLSETPTVKGGTCPY